MSLRIDTNELISGAYVVGETGLGVLAENIPSTGLDGASFLHNDLSLPADNGKEIRGLIVTPPASGTFYVWEDGSFSLIGAPDNTYPFTYRLYVDGVDLGTVESTIVVGDGLAGTAALGDFLFSGALIGSTLVDAPLTNLQMQQLFVWVNELTLIHGLVVGSTLTVTPTTRAAGTVDQTIGEVGTTVTVTRT